MKAFKSHSLTPRQAEWLLASIIIARSTSYLFSKTALSVLDPFTLLAIRFLIASFLLLPLFWQKRKSIRLITIGRGALLGAIFFTEMTAEMFALKHTSTSTASLLVNTAVVLVPLLEALLHRTFPNRLELAGALITFCGIACLTLRNGSFSLQGGEPLCLLAALIYAAFIILTNRFSHQDDSLTLGLFQMGFLALFSTIAAFLTETPRLHAAGSIWWIILWLAVICSDFGLTFQPVAQRHTSAERTAVFCALNPLTSAILGFLLLHENFGPLGLLGAVLILAGLFISTHAKTASSPS